MKRLKQSVNEIRINQEPIQNYVRKDSPSKSIISLTPRVDNPKNYYGNFPIEPMKNLVQKYNKFDDKFNEQSKQSDPNWYPIIQNNLFIQPFNPEINNQQIQKNVYLNSHILLMT